MNDLARVQATAEEIGEALSALTRGSRSTRIWEQIRAQSGVDLDRSGFAVLVTLESCGSLRVSELADACGLDISTMSRQVARMQRDGLLVVSPSEVDRRALKVSATEAGAAQAAAVRAARRAALERVLGVWTDEERVLFARLLGRFVTQLANAAERDASSGEAET